MRAKYVIVIACLGFLIFLRFLPLFTGQSQNQVSTIESPKKAELTYEEMLKLLPLERQDPLAAKHFAHVLSHPWIQAQEGVGEISFEMIKDINLIKHWYTNIAQNAKKRGKVPISEEQVTQTLISSLATLQEDLPFAFPSTYYSVLSIAESPPDWYPTPVTFQVYKRLYLDETDLGMPVYLDVRVFHLKDEKHIEKIIDWHVDLLTDATPLKNTLTAQGGKYIAKGWRNQERDTSHGFATLQGERGLFLYFICQEKTLYLAIADAPWQTFEKHMSLFQKLGTLGMDPG